MKRIELSEEELNEQKVTLKPIFGIQPESYIKYVYAFLLILVIFLILMLPGILKNGTYYKFLSTPGGASVTVDGVRLGATPGEYFVPRGKREIIIKSPYHKTSKETVNVKGRLFGTLLFKRRNEYNAPLDFNMSRESLSNEHLVTASWFQSDEGYKSLPLPPLMTGLVKGYYRSPQNSSELTEDDLLQFHLSLLRSASQSQAYSEWLESAALLATKGKVIDPGNYLSAVKILAEFLEDHPESMNLFENYHEVNLPDSLSALPSILSERNSFKREIDLPSIKPLSSDPLQFRFIGTTTENRQDFEVFAADREITKGWYSLFLEDHPEWSPSALPDLLKKQLTDSHYLQDWDSEILPNRSMEPLRFVSYNAAEAFCFWMKEKYFSDSKDIIVRLPDEWEWEEIAGGNGLENSDRPSQKNLGPLEAGSFQPGELNLYDMEGNLWEWCQNGFGINDPFLYNTLPSAGDTEFPFPDMAVRGGSWANNPGQVNSETRGSQPRNWCTAYVGFRPLLLIKR